MTGVSTYCSKHPRIIATQSCLPGCLIGAMPDGDPQIRGRLSLEKAFRPPGQQARYGDFRRINGVCCYRVDWLILSTIVVLPSHSTATLPSAFYSLQVVN